MADFNLPLDIDSLEIIKQTTDKDGNFILEVVSKKKHSTCHRCGKPATKPNGTAPTRMVRHLSVFDTPVYLKITPIRYKCENCDDNATTTEQYDWCGKNSSTTNGLDDYIMRSLINSTIEDVAKKERVGQKLVRDILDRQVTLETNWDKITDIETIGIDEISIKKGHQSYFTVISAKTRADELLVLAVIRDRFKDDIKSFLQSIPTSLQQTVKHVCSDMYDGYVNAAIEVFGVQSLVIDRYHVAKLYRKPLDKIRVKEMARLKKELPESEYSKLEGMMWILRKKHECLSQTDKDKLSLLYKHSPLLKKAHKYALNLTHIFNKHSSRKYAMAKIGRWIDKVEKSNINIFDVFIKTLQKYKPYIGNYFKSRKSSGFVEGLNNKIKVLKRRCYGLAKATSIFQRLFLDLQGYECYA